MSGCTIIARLGPLAWALSLAMFTACSREAPSPDLNQQPPGQAVSAPAAGTDDHAASLPQAGGPVGYVGSANCRACHEDEFESWHRSYHRTMTQVASPETVRANFHDVVLTNDGVRFTLSQRSNELWIRMERPGSGGAEEAGAALDVRAGLVTGSHHMQVFWVAGGQGNMQVGFPFTWLIPEQRWVPRNSTFVRPPDTVHRAEVWNVICSRCHATGIEPRVDSAAQRMETRAGELGIACEACHGPGERHAAARKRDSDPTLRPSAEVLAAEIVHPKKIPAARSAQVCGFCHSMKWIDRSEAWRQGGFRFRPGDDLETTTPVIRPARVADIPGLSQFLERNPELLRDYFWPDGMIRVSGREYNGLIDSPCHSGGRFSCVSCHSLHDSDPDDQLARNRTGDAACTQCHEAYRNEEAITAHTHHAAGSSGSTCYNCHMPHTTYGVLKAIRSHQVSSPRVADEVATGRPNACNLCHLDRTLAWTAGHLAGWYGHDRPALPKEAETTADAVRLALSGDAGQRVLIAWHLGWPEALRASGTNWVAPILGQLLDDPYAAVRCVAERSLRSHSNLVPAGYDYVPDPAGRPPARASVWRAWQMEWRTSGVGMPPAVLLDPENLPAQQAAFDEWLGRRDDRPVRLRE